MSLFTRILYCLVGLCSWQHFISGKEKYCYSTPFSISTKTPMAYVEGEKKKIARRGEIKEFIPFPVHFPPGTYSIHVCFQLKERN